MERMKRFFSIKDKYLRRYVLAIKKAIEIKLHSINEFRVYLEEHHYDIEGLKADVEKLTKEIEKLK